MIKMISLQDFFLWSIGRHRQVEIQSKTGLYFTTERPARWKTGAGWTSGNIKQPKISQKEIQHISGRMSNYDQTTMYTFMYIIPKIPS